MVHSPFSTIDKPCFWRKERIPENETSIPFTTYGRLISFLPLRAICSRLEAGNGSLGKLMVRANLKQKRNKTNCFVCKYPKYKKNIIYYIKGKKALPVKAIPYCNV